MKRLSIQTGSTLERTRRRYRVAFALAFGLAAVSSAANASTSVSGTADSATVDAQNASIREVLSALGQKFRLQIDSSTNLDKRISGSYRGSLSRIVARLLEGHNFILRTDKDELVVTVLGTENRQNITSVSGRNSSTASNPSPAARQPREATATGTLAAAAPISAATKSAVPGSKSTSPTADLSAFEFKIADGSAAVPTLGAATTSGPIPKPATTQMPKPTPSSGGPNVLPNPTPAHGVVLPMPTGSAPFPGMSAGIGTGQTPPPAATGKPPDSTAAAPPSVSPPSQSTAK